MLQIGASYRDRWLQASYATTRLTASLCMQTRLGRINCLLLLRLPSKQCMYRLYVLGGTITVTIGYVQCRRNYTFNTWTEDRTCIMHAIWQLILHVFNVTLHHMEENSDGLSVIMVI